MDAQREALNLVKVFSATMARDRDRLGERVTAWIQEHPAARAGPRARWIELAQAKTIATSTPQMAKERSRTLQRIPVSWRARVPGANRAAKERNRPSDDLPDPLRRLSRTSRTTAAPSRTG